MKILIGLVLVIASVWWIAMGSSTLIGRSGLGDVIVLLNASIPLFIILVGLLILWLEMDSLKSKPKESAPPVVQSAPESSEMSMSDEKTPLEPSMTEDVNDKKEE